MKDQDCERYLADPEANAAHLERCSGCRALFAPAAIDSESVALDALPLAPWEGARHRAWGLVAAAAALVLGSACALFAMAGVSPAAGLGGSLGAVLPSIDLLQLTLLRVGSAMQHVPVGWQIAIAIAFVGVNTLLYVLLRRAPRGLDV